MMQYNGRNGCPCCLHPGEQIGHNQTYPSNIEYHQRTTQNMKRAAAKAEKEHRVVDGVKGRTVLDSIVDLATGAPIDYMHCILFK